MIIVTAYPCKDDTIDLFFIFQVIVKGHILLVPCFGFGVEGESIILQGFHFWNIPWLSRISTMKHIPRFVINQFRFGWCKGASALTNNKQLFFSGGIFNGLIAKCWDTLFDSRDITWYCWLKSYTTWFPGFPPWNQQLAICVTWLEIVSFRERKTRHV